VIVNKILARHGLTGVCGSHIFHEIRKHAIVRHPVNVVIPNPCTKSAELASSVIERNCACQSLITSRLSEARINTAMDAFVSGTVLFHCMARICRP
jgi:hypothetical protein